MKNAAKLSLYLILAPLAFAGLGDLCQKQTKGFRLQNIYPSKEHPSLQDLTQEFSSEQIEEIKKILNQPFRFIKKGQQCYVFLSDDGKYVIKFFRWEKLEPPLWAKWINTKRSRALTLDREKKLNFDFLSYKIAFENLKEETGLVYIQLGSLSPFKTPLEIYDNIGIRHKIESNGTGFILQKKAEDFFPYFKEKINTENEKDLQPFLSSLLDLIENRIQNGITDSDVSLEYNMGMLEGKPILFDIGNLQTESFSLNRKDLIKKETRLVLSSLKKLAPSSALFLENEIEQRYSP